MHFPRCFIHTLRWQLLAAPVAAAALLSSLSAQDTPPAQNPPAQNPAAVQPEQPNPNAPAPNAPARRGRGGAGARGPAPQVVSPRDEQPWTPNNFDKINPNLPTLFMAGDSTADRGPDAWHRGWAAVLIDYFDTSKINVVNRALGGRSFRSFVREGRWDALVAQVKPGDYVLIQFGHNDGGAVTAANGRPDLPGTGPETEKVARQDGTEETVLTYGAYARKYINEVKAKGGIPIILTVTASNPWLTAEFRPQPGDRPSNMYRWGKEVADAEKVQWLDHQAAISDAFRKTSKEQIATFFIADHLHTTTPGAIFNCEQFVAAIRGLDNHPLAAYLNDAGKKIEPWKASAPTP